MAPQGDDVLVHLLPGVSRLRRVMESRIRASVALLLVAVLAAIAVLLFVKASNDPASSNGVSRNQQSFTTSQRPPPVCEADNGVVASDDERCSIVGRNTLIQGGQAIDAAVATALCEGVVNPMSSGIGGGGFLVMRLANGSAFAYDFREVAPAAASKDMYASNPSSKNDGALSAGVPGELAGLHLAWQRFGRLPWKSLIEPAIKFARDGFMVTSYLEFEINSTLTKIMAHENLRKLLSPNGKLVKTGDILFNPELATTLELIAEQGPGIFYNGSVGEKMIEDVQRAGGIMTFDDLKSYKVEIREPVAADVIGFTFLGMPPPSSGGPALTLILNILSNFGNLSAVPDDLHYHRLVEAFKHAYAARMNLGDPAFSNISSALHDMLSPEFALKLQKRIVDNATFAPEYYGSEWEQLVDHGTCHFGIVDSDRNAISLTTTINWPFGSKLLSKSTGIILNNEMDDFSVPKDVLAPGEFPPPEANFVAPNKRPLSSMSPTIVLQNGQLRGVLGASGGIKIITGVAQVFLNYFIRGMDPLTAVTTPRVHHQLIPNEVDCENWRLVSGEVLQVPQELRGSLSEKGHKVIQNGGYCVSQLIVHDLIIPAGNHKHQPNNDTVYYGRLTGVSDFRKEGFPAGF